MALDGATGAVLWERDMLAEFGMTAEQELRDLPYGRAGSPLVVGDLLVVPAGGPSDGETVSLVALDRSTGEEVWRGGDAKNPRKAIGEAVLTDAGDGSAIGG